MYRRRIRRENFTLFPFLSVLASLMGVLLIIIITISLLAVGPDASQKWLVPGKVGNTNLIEWDGDYLYIHPARTPIVWSNAKKNKGINSTAFGTLIQESMQNIKNGKKITVFIAVRPSGFSNFDELLQLLLDKKIDVGYEPVQQSVDLEMDLAS